MTAFARLHRILGTALVVAWCATAASAQVRIVQTNSGGDNIHLIDPTTNAIVGEVTGVPINHGAAAAPDGSRLYVVYNAFTTPYRETTFTPRGLIGVFRTAAMGAAGPSAWTTLHRSPVGDPRASSQNNLQAEFLGDYVYADATNTYGVGVWNDVRAGVPCAAMNTWRMALRTEEDAGDPPNPLAACAPGFGETDIWSFTTG